VAGDVIHCQRTVFSGPSHRSDLVQATGKGDQTKPADSAVSRFQTRDAAKRSRLPNRTAGIAAECNRSQASGDGGCRSSAGASRDVLRVEGVERRTEVRVFGRATHREFVHVGFTNVDRGRLV